MMGETAEDIAAWLHHADPRTTEQNYRHLRPRGRARIAANRRLVVTMRTHLLGLSLETPDGGKS